MMPPYYYTLSGLLTPELLGDALSLRRRIVRDNESLKVWEEFAEKNPSDTTANFLLSFKKV